MPIKKIKILTYAIYILFSFSGLVWAENPVEIPAELRNKEFMEKARWTDATFFQKITSNWDKYTGTQSIEGKEMLYEKKIQIYGADFSVSARRFSDGVFEFVFSNTSSFSKDFREKFVSYAIKTWGMPSKNIDNSYGAGLVQQVDMEWLLKGTQIKLGLFGAKMFEGTKENPDGWVSGLCVLTITQQGKYAPLKDLIALKCEGQQQFFDSKEITPVSPFIIFVDLNHNQFLRSDRSLMQKITQISDDYFMAQWMGKNNLKNELIIDRKLGTYQWKMSDSKSGLGANNWGKCEKTDLNLQPKF